MLVIARKKGEGFFVGDDIHVVVVNAGDKIRLGIDAPKDTQILRDEIYTSQRGTVPNNSAEAEKEIARFCRVIRSVPSDRLYLLNYHLMRGSAAGVSPLKAFSKAIDALEGVV